VLSCVVVQRGVIWAIQSNQAVLTTVAKVVRIGYIQHLNFALLKGRGRTMVFFASETVIKPNFYQHLR
jgi:hypothetical protein